MGYLPADTMTLKLVDVYLMNKFTSWRNREKKNCKILFLNLKIFKFLFHRGSSC